MCECERGRVGTRVEGCEWSKTVAALRAQASAHWHPLGAQSTMPRMFHVVLYRPEIPPNTGNVIRLCANTGCRLHLVRPLGFRMDDADLRRAGLDYHEHATTEIHDTLEACVLRLRALGSERTFAFTTSGDQGSFESARFIAGDAFLFGPESAGLPDDVVAIAPESHRIRLPMRPGQRSLNLSNAVAVAVFEAWRQQGFQGSR